MKTKGIYWTLLTALAAACGAAEQPAAPEAPAAPEPAHSAEVRAYVAALQTGDRTALLRVVSQDLRARITQPATSPITDTRLSAFMEKEARALSRSIGGADATKAVAVAAVRDEGDGVLALTLRIDGAPLDKPFYLVKEDGQYKINVVPPAARGTLAGGWKSFRIKNQDGVNRSFTCTGSVSVPVAAGQEIRQACQTSCGRFLSAGTRFTVNGGSADCDYNTWGVDLYIQNNSPRCADPC